jgi:predicted Zn finger-like uncharacterized protein
MKIVCDSCSAKYSIADEKVAGRVFKIRCKKCGAAIVVKGESQAAEAAPAAGGGNFDYGGEAVWHTVVDGEQQGPFAPAQLGSMISAGTIGWDAYVWREGFDDWKPAQDIEELVQAIMNPGGAPAAASGGGDDPFSSDNPTVAQSSPSPAKSSAPAKKNAGADLFAQSEASPFGGGGGGDDDDVVASTASPRVSSNQAMTGQRNENSVLFSLSNLQALATGSPSSGGSSSKSPSSSGSTASPSKAGMAAGEGSGLIDIRALASATGLGGGGGGGPVIGSGPAPKVDDLLSIGSPSVGLGSALAAPVIIAEKPEPARGGGSGMIIAAAIIAVAFLGGAGLFAYVSLNQPDPAATGPATATIAPATPPPTTAVAPPPTTTVAAPPPTSEAPAATTVASGGGGGGGGHGRRPAGGSGSSSTGSGATAAADPAPSGGSGSSGSRPSGGGGGDRSIDDLLSGALAGGPRRPAGGGSSSSSSSAPAAASTAGLPTTPGRSDVVGAMNGVQSAVTACGSGEHGVASVSVSVSGSNGHVSNASVTGQFAGTPVGSCIARAVRSATFPRFSQATFTFTYPFRI